jgi:hypothetical protein
MTPGILNFSIRVGASIRVESSAALTADKELDFNLICPLLLFTLKMFQFFINDLCWLPHFHFNSRDFSLNTSVQ